MIERANDNRHAELSPSSSERWINCTASVRFTKGVVEEESEYAREGTLAHEKLELWLSLGVPPLDGELYYQLEPVYQSALKLESEGYDVQYEKRVTYNDRLWGTADILGIKGRKLRLRDYKHGYAPVYEFANPQMLTYAMCIEAETGVKFTDIELTVDQPRMPHINGTSRTYVCTREILDWHIAEVIYAIKKADGNDAEFKAGKWCRYCPKLGNCRTATNYFAKMISGKPLL